MAADVLADQEFSQRLLARLRRDTRFLLTTHRNADPDGLGAELALKFILNELGFDALIVNQESVPERLAFLDPQRWVRSFDATSADLMLGRTVVFLDNSDPGRAGPLATFVAADRSNLVIIDHHDGLPCDFETAFLAAHVGSTSEMIYALGKAAGVQWPAWVASALYAGIVVDTGHFRYGKTRPSTHLAAAELLAAGVLPAEMAERLIDNMPVERLLLKKTLYNQIKFNEDRTLAYIPVRRRYVEELGLAYDDLEGIINELIQPTQVQVGIMLTERERELTRVSVRSRGAVDVLPAVVRFGGGGHKNACGATLMVSLDEAVELFIPVAEEVLAASMGRR